MSDILQIIQLAFSSLIIPAVAYIIKLERRLYKLEHSVGIILENLSRRRGDKRHEKG